MVKNEDWRDDPRLTAYALGELPDDELPDVLALLEQSPAAREAVTYRLSATAGSVVRPGFQLPVAVADH